MVPKRGTPTFLHSPTGWIAPDGTVYGPWRAEHWWTLQQAGFYRGVITALDEGWIRYAFYGPDWMIIEGQLDYLEKYKSVLVDLGFQHMTRLNPDEGWFGEVVVDVHFPGGTIADLRRFTVGLNQLEESSIASNLYRQQVAVHSTGSQTARRPSVRVRQYKKVC